MSYKTRSNYPVGICLRKCANRDKGCFLCIGFSEYEPENVSYDTKNVSNKTNRLSKVITKRNKNGIRYGK